MTEPLDLRPPDTTIHTRAKYHSLLGFSWWSAKVVSAYGLDYPEQRIFRARTADRAENKAIAHFVHKQARRRERTRERSHETLPPKHSGYRANTSGQWVTTPKGRKLPKPPTCEGGGSKP